MHYSCLKNTLFKIGSFIFNSYLIILNWITQTFFDIKMVFQPFRTALS